jgi:hypothetical protein
LSDLIATDERRGPRLVFAANVLVCLVFFPVTLTLLPRDPLAAPFIAFALAFSGAAVFLYAAATWLAHRP